MLHSSTLCLIRPMVELAEQNAGTTGGGLLHPGES
jgi:hypothetical protein